MCASLILPVGLLGCVLIPHDEVDHLDPTSVTGDTSATPTGATGATDTTDTSEDTSDDTGQKNPVICPDPGKTAVVATVVDYSGSELVQEDLVSFVSLAGFAVVSVAVATGDQVIPPFDLVATDFEPGTYNLTACIDRAPSSKLCNDADDISVIDIFGSYDLQPDMVQTYEVDFATRALIQTGVMPKDAACP